MWHIIIDRLQLEKLKKKPGGSSGPLLLLPDSLQSTWFCECEKHSGRALREARFSCSHSPKISLWNQSTWDGLGTGKISLPAISTIKERRRSRSESSGKCRTPDNVKKGLIWDWGFLSGQVLKNLSGFSLTCRFFQKFVGTSDLTHFGSKFCRDRLIRPLEDA